MSRYAIINGGNVVTQVVVWDGGPSWAPPAGQTAVLLPDDSLFVEPRGTLNPQTLAFVRAAPVVPNLNDPTTVTQTLLDKGQQAFTSNVAYIANGAPTNPQVAAQVLSLTKQMNGIYKLISGRLNDTSGT